MTTPSKTILLFGGTFDPPHRAHLELPNRIARTINADELWYIPATLSPFKSQNHQTSTHHRLAMLKRALPTATCGLAPSSFTTTPHHTTQTNKQTNPPTRIITDEIDRPGPSYTIDTLRALRKRLPQNINLRLLIGTDQARAFHRWKSYTTIEKIAEPLVMLRPPTPPPTPPHTPHTSPHLNIPRLIDSLLDSLPESFDRQTWHSRIIIPAPDCPPLNISATDIRQRIANHQPITHLIPTPVADYIQKHNLYTPPQ